MKNMLKNYEEMLDNLHFLTSRGRWDTKLKYNLYFMLAMLAPIFAITIIIISIYISSF